jgi:putative heme-binding domain-containing protein
MLVPGFTVHELPVKLSNQNNLRFAPDGSLTSLGYDGKVWRLRDTNGDGLEDTAEPVWDQPTLSVPLGMAWSTAGLYVSSKGKVSLLRDTNADGRAETEDIIASGWPATDVGSGGVDATAVTLDQEGNLFFGLLVADYANAYRLRKRGELKPAEVEWLKQSGRWKEPSGPEAANDEFSLYDLNSKRGTIQKLDPRTKRLETVATGLRVPVALAFNREGDLFNTDQEGETWMPNGNPLDELNHIILGRNYGFPPRHGKWLPDLVSEPPVVAFGPQHQSACGLVFNESRLKTENWRLNTGIPLPAFPAQGLFGPKWWEGDAFVAGESRGKIWRVRLVKTPHGYVGKSYTIARLDLLTLDLAISPKGDLYVCCHSGPPDWGTGPQGEGKIFKISYTDPKAPQPVAVWPASPTEVRIAFDRPLDPSVTNAFNVGQAASLPGSEAGATNRSDQQPASRAGWQPALPTIEFGEYVSAGDRFEVLKPPYAVVEQQDATPRGKLVVRRGRLRDDNRTLVLTTDPHTLAVNYALNVGGWEVGYDFQGCYIYASTPTAWGKVPNAVKSRLQNLGIGQESAEWTGGSLLGIGIGRELNRGFGISVGNPAKDGQTDAYTSLNLPPDTVAVSVRSDAEVEMQVGGVFERPEIRSAAFVTTTKQVSGHWGSLNWNTAYNGTLLFLRGPGTASAQLTFLGRGETQERTIPLEAIRLPWAPTNRASAGTDSRPVPKPQGDWEHGRELFTGTALNCAKCHRIRGKGGLTGPDLSNLIHRDARSVERDIREPSATLHPDYMTYLAELKNGDSLTGFIRSKSRTGSLPVPERGASSPRSPGEPETNTAGRLAARPTLEDAVVLFDADGKDTVVLRTDLRNLHPTGQSLMPTGLLDALKPDDVRDLLTFLLWEPPVRTKAEAERVMAASPPSPLGGERGDSTTSLKQPTPPPALSPPAGSGEGKASAAIRIVLVASKQDHGPGQHDYPRWQEKWLRLLSSLGHSSPSQSDSGNPTASATVPLSLGERDRVRAGQPSRPEPAPSSNPQSSQSLLTSAPTNVSVETAWEWPSADQFATADVLVFYFWNHDWSPARYAQFDAYQKRGGGVVILHSACIADREPEKLAERIGLSATPGTVSYRHMPFDLSFVAKDHPLVRGLPERLHFLDEPYWPLIGDPSRVTVLANGQVDGATKPLVWTFERDGIDGRRGRVFGSILGHYFWTLDDPLYRLLVLRGIAWAGGADLNRLADAALLEAAVK